MSYYLTNELLSKGAPCHWTPSVGMTYFILASRYQDDTKRAYPGLDGFKRVMNLQKSAIMNNLTQLQKEGWIIKTKRGQTGQRAEYKVLYIESDLYRCQCATPCNKQGSISVRESFHSDTKEIPLELETASTGLSPKRRTNLTNKTSQKIDEDRFDSILSKIPSHIRVQINSGSNYEVLINELLDKGVVLTQIRDFLGSINWTTSTAPGGLLLSTLRKYLVEMSKPSNSITQGNAVSENLTNDDQFKNTFASLVRGMRLPD
jgi:hypothetical protein